jgi:hypothetical protein
VCLNVQLRNFSTRAVHFTTDRLLARLPEICGELYALSIPYDKRLRFLEITETLLQLVLEGWKKEIDVQVEHDYCVFLCVCVDKHFIDDGNNLVSQVGDKVVKNLDLDYTIRVSGAAVSTFDGEWVVAELGESMREITHTLDWYIWKRYEPRPDTVDDSLFKAKVVS